MHDLNQIQRLQFADKKRAEKLLLEFIVARVNCEVTEVSLNPKPESLNSLNGFAKFQDGKTFFFKTHTEENEQIAQYYSEKLLEDAGYPVVIPQVVNAKPGEQIVFYEMIHLPTLFDLVKAEEDKLLLTGELSQEANTLLQLQGGLENKVCEAYLKTLQKITVKKNSEAPIHQLFNHRLADSGRVGLFYRDKNINLGKLQINFKELAKMHWDINGVSYASSIGQIIEDSRKLLDPQNATVAVVGHGDAHNGNVFVDLQNNKLLLFDAAFAGLHSPLLDLVKPLFHNIFARWMYFPQEVVNEFSIDFSISENKISVSHSFEISQLRKKFLEIKIEKLISPLLASTISKEVFVANWRDILRAALFCCPMLTVNLAADYNSRGKLAETYLPAVKLLGLCFAVQMGSRTVNGRSSLLSFLD